MGRSSAFIWVCLLLGLGMLTHTTDAQNSPRRFLAAHNAARAQVGVGPMVWDKTVAAYAQSYANSRIRNCTPVDSGGPYGENIFWGMGREFTAADAVSSWVADKNEYNYSTNACISSPITCLDYTQVVWRNSVRLGCARVKCNGGVNSGAILISCNYAPRGNIKGQRPY